MPILISFGSAARFSRTGFFVLGLLAPTALAASPTEITSCTTITESGSYVLANNLTPAAPGDCIVISAHYVTLDLRGFTIRGVVVRPTGRVGAGVTTHRFPVSLPSDFGAYTAFRGITVRDGTILDFQDGIRLAGSEMQIERIRSVANGRNGIFVSDCPGPYCDQNVWASATIRDCLTLRNAADGIRLTAVFGGGGVLTGNVAIRNAGEGIVAGCPSVVVNNTAQTIQLGGSGCSEAHNATP